MQCIVQLPGNHITAVPINESYQVDKALCGTNVRNICAPDMVGIAGSYPSKQIWVDSMARGRLTGVGFGVDGLESQGCHEVTDTFPANMDVIASFQLNQHPPGAI